MTPSEIFHQIGQHLLEDARPSQALEQLFAQPLPAEFDPLQRLKTTKGGADVFLDRLCNQSKTTSILQRAHPAEG